MKKQSKIENMETDINFGALSIRYYLEQYNEILDLTYDFGTLNPDIDSQGGCGFKLYGHTFLITLDTMNCFSCAVITTNHDLIFVNFGDTNEFISFLDLLKMNILLYNQNFMPDSTFDSFFNIGD